MHYEGSPECSEHCTEKHIGDDILANAPESCPECGGNGRACALSGCMELRFRRYEPWEGMTGQESLFGDDDDTWNGVGRLHHNPYARY